MAKNRAIGIDLGTTNSCVAVLEDSRVTVIPNRAGYRITPSIIAFTEDNKVLVGHLAKRQAVINAQNTAYAIKRLIGRRFDSHEVKRTIDDYPFSLVKGPHDDVRIKLRDKIFSIPELSALILVELKHVAEEYIQDSVNEAVITVPAYFNDSQRQATKDAGKIAGLEVLRIINEPTSAALAYGLNKKNDERIAVFDFGGGTFDISILELSAGVFEVIACSGDTFLGGEDFDNRVTRYLIEEFKKETSIDLSEEKMAVQRLREAAEKAKCELSTVKEANINLPFIGMDAKGPKHFIHTIKREKLEELSADLVDSAVQITEALLKDAGLTPNSIDEVLLVGGQTRMPLVVEKVNKLFGKTPHKGINPDESVAIGAAVQAAALVEEKKDILLLDVTPLSLGIATYGGYCTKIIERNTPVPVKKGHIFTTAEDNQIAVKIRVLQGESEDAKENELLGEFILTGIRKAKKGEPEIDVTFDINADGIVSVLALDKATGKEQSIQVTSSSGLTEEEVKEMSEEAKLYELVLKE